MVSLCFKVRALQTSSTCARRLMTSLRWREAFDARKDDNDAIVPRYVTVLCSEEGIKN